MQRRCAARQAGEARAMALSGHGSRRGPFHAAFRPPVFGDDAPVSPIATSFSRALRSLSQPGILWHLIWPSLASVALWGALAWFYGGALATWLAGALGNFSWLAGWFGAQQAASAASLTAGVLLFLALIPLIYVTAAMIVAVFALPLVLELVGERDYADLQKRRGGSQAGSLANALVALAWYLTGMIVSLPLWLIPGLALALPLLLSAWLNQRAYRYDALMQHADPDEYRKLVAAHRGKLMLVGLGAGALNYVPLLNLFAPAFAGLAFVHYCLEGLRRMRAGK